MWLWLYRFPVVLFLRQLALVLRLRLFFSLYLCLASPNLHPYSPLRQAKSALLSNNKKSTYSQCTEGLFHRKTWRQEVEGESPLDLELVWMLSTHVV